MANLMNILVKEKTLGLKMNEDYFSVDGDNGRIKVISDDIRRGELKKLRDIGAGLRILVGAGDKRDLCIVWAGDGNSNIGAIHDTIASQFMMDIRDGHVPLEESPTGQLRVTTTAQGIFDDPREVEDVLDRNKQFRKAFGTQRVDMSALSDW